MPSHIDGFNFNERFPCLAALGGFAKSSVIPKGWITYMDECLLICTGSAAKGSCSPPDALAFDGDDKYIPASPDNILFKVDVKCTSIQQLFDVAEGLLATLKG